MHFYAFINISINTVKNAGLQTSWESKGFFAPIPLLSPIDETIKWYINTFNDIFISPGGFEYAGLAGMLFMTGCFSLFLKNKYKLSLLLVPILLTLFASSMQKYTFSTITDYVQGGRLILFLLPSLLMVVAEGIEYFRVRTHKAVVIFILAILLLHPLLTAVRYLENPRLGEEVKPVIEYVLKNQESSDKIYLYYRIKHQFDYYQDLLDFSKPKYLIRGSRLNKDKYIKDLENLTGNDRVWFLFSYTLETSKQEKEFFLEQLDKRGIQLDSFERHGASAYLYKLSK